ncbi:energy-coupling factor transporter transmembrane component T family protein [Luteimicrobium subarcticum]|uniref:Biotin transport system permease protein n=1 Tax=Luteimicrobium subarcticum TaxID=620910 RepID=A0A2M8WU91_9MICO|nr:energy-coupling factor transporter transmembrane protein EcfT [Luteimicrobium subarcticum]PJI94510.1 biotin transport system permease protein [Luteimicrobium subarcticum]
MTLLGAYVPRDSVVHRAPAGAKLVALLAVSVAVLAVPGPWAVTSLAALLLAVTLAARLRPRHLWQQVRPLRFAVPVLFALQWWSLGPERAALLCARLVLLVALAGTLTLTTRTSDVLDALTAATRPLRVVGVRPDRVALVLALTVRSIPVLVALSDDVRAAQRARGRERDVRAYAVPLVVGTLRRADALGEALRARGVDD